MSVFCVLPPDWLFILINRSYWWRTIWFIYRTILHAAPIGVELSLYVRILVELRCGLPLKNRPDTYLDSLRILVELLYGLPLKNRPYTYLYSLTLLRYWYLLTFLLHLDVTCPAPGLVILSYEIHLDLPTYLPLCRVIMPQFMGVVVFFPIS